jgi:hypothetical protein
MSGVWGVRLCGYHGVLFVAGGRNYPALGTRIAVLTRTELCCMHTSGACERYLMFTCMKLRFGRVQAVGLDYHCVHVCPCGTKKMLKHTLKILDKQITTITT